jgi:hypothetical protein
VANWIVTLPSSTWVGWVSDNVVVAIVTSFPGTNGAGLEEKLMIVEPFGAGGGGDRTGRPANAVLVTKTLLKANSAMVIPRIAIVVGAASFFIVISRFLGIVFANVCVLCLAEYW